MNRMRDQAPATTSSWLDSHVKTLLFAWTDFALRRPWTVVVSAVLLAALGGYVYFFHLPILSDRDALLDADLKSNQARQSYRAEFGDDRYLILVVTKPGSPATNKNDEHPSSSERAAMKAVASQWSERLRTRPDLFPKVVDRLGEDALGPLSVLYLPMDQLNTIAKLVLENEAELRTWFADPSLQTLLELLNGILSRVTPDAGNNADNKMMLDQFESLIQVVQDQLATGPPPSSNAGESPAGRLARGSYEFADLRKDLLFHLSQGHLDPDGYLFFSNGRILTVLSEVVGDPARQNRYEEPLEFARQALDEVLAGQVQGVEAGLAGFPALEYEEMKTGLTDIARGTIITAVLVLFLFIAGFRSLLRPLLATLCLALSLGITCLFIWAALGHLTLIAMVFAIIMVAVGIDFAIHFSTHYEEALHHGASPAEAIRHTIDSAGGPIWLGGITTCAAFLSACFTSFKGLSELGLIAGAGLLICLVCMSVVFPSLLVLVDSRPRLSSRRPAKVHLSRLRLRLPALGGITGSVMMLAVGTLVTLGFIFGQYHVDTNLLNLQQEDGDANQWQRLLLDTDDVATFAMLTFHDRGELETVRERLEASPLVRRTESLFPFQESEKRAIVAPVCSEFTSFRSGSSGNTDVFSSRRELFKMRQRIRQYRRKSPEAEEALGELEKQLESLYLVLSEEPSSIHPERLAALDESLADLSSRSLAGIQSYACPPPFSADLVPDFLRHRFLGENGSLALFVYPSGNVWNREELEEFIWDTRKYAPGMFGEVVSFYENGTSLIRSFLQSACYSIIAIILLIYFWHRRIRLTFLATLPLICSIGILLGWMRWGPYPVPWNYANFFALPILIGVGVDSGIHLVRAYLSGESDIYNSASRAVFLSLSTTIIGFAVLATSDHIGIRYLGYILFCGILACLVCSLAMLPTAMNLLLRKRPYGDE